jgi:D-arabinose 1-dehydrogenase-like Zn-dependent alcohol dehydrogenase
VTGHALIAVPGITSACVRGGAWGVNGIDGGQGEVMQAPLADGTFVKVPGSYHSNEILASLLTLSDVMCTGHHAAVSAGVKKGDTVAIVGDELSVCVRLFPRYVKGQSVFALSQKRPSQTL